MEQNIAVGAEVPKSKGLSMRGLIRVFLKPSDFFEHLKNDPKILVPYIVLAILLTVVFMLSADLIVKLQMESPEYQERMQGQDIGPTAIAFMKGSAVVAGVIGFLLAPLISAGLALLFGNFVMAGQARFKQILSVTLYAALIWVFGMLVTLPMVLIKESLTVGLSLGVLVADQGPSSLAFIALSKIDLFNIWEIIVAGIGFAAVYNFPRNKGYWLAVLSVGMLSILHVVFTAIAKSVF